MARGKENGYTGSYASFGTTSTAVEPDRYTPATQSSSPVRSSPQSSYPMINEDVEIRGELAFGERLDFNGRFEGTIQSDGYLTVGEAALVKGNVYVGSALIAGKIQGEVVVADRLHLKPEAIIHGDVKAASIVIEDGAYITGKIITTPNERSSVDFSLLFSRLLPKK